MGDRLNRYQRRQADRQMNRIAVGTFLMTLLFFAIGAFLVHSSYMDAVYRQVLASGGTLTVDQVQASYLANLVIPFVMVWIALAVIVAISEARSHNNFHFGEAAPAVSKGRRGKLIQLHNLRPRQFEEAVAHMIAEQGYQTKVVGGAGDHGVDVKVFNAQGRLVGVVQCKRRRPGRALSPEHVRALATVRDDFRVNIAYLATTTHFTEETRLYAKQHGVRLIDGDDLKRIIHKTPLPPKPEEDFERSMNGLWAEPPPSTPPVNERWQSPKRPMTEQERIQQQLDERRARLNSPKP